MTVGAWHHWEALLTANSAPGVADGVLQWWIDGTLVTNAANVVYTTASYKNLFYHWYFYPDWGGTGGCANPDAQGNCFKTRDDYLLIDHLYISGIPKGQSGAVCGNGIVESGEACDLGTGNGACPAACSTSCTNNNCGGDTTPPIATITLPQNGGTYPLNQPLDLVVTTDEVATCHRSTQDAPYNTMTGTFPTTTGTTHTAPLTLVNTAGTYTRYVRCQDTAGNAMNNSATTTFTISANPPPKIGDQNGDGKVDAADILIIAADLSKTSGFNPANDLNNDGKVDLYDLVLATKNWG